MTLAERRKMEAAIREAWRRDERVARASHETFWKIALKVFNQGAWRPQ